MTSPKASRPIRRREPDPDSLKRLSGIDPLLARLFAARGIADPAELRNELGRLLPVGTLEGVSPAAELIAFHLRERHRILVVGDFDADGATSTALMIRVLRACGADVDYLLPNRFVHGYGLTPGLVAEARAREPALIITVDSGIACNPGVEAARSAGIDVLVTDHHLPPQQLPPASVIVNPNLAGCRFGSRNLAGVGVAFYVLAALVRRLESDGGAGHGRPAPPSPGLWLDLVALGTVADMVPLDRNNRILVAEGLRRLRAGRGTPGIAALLEAGGRRLESTVSSDLGFAAGPRLNAAGRLDDMAVGVECLLADDPASAARLAGMLSDLNTERKEIEKHMQNQAIESVEKLAARMGGEPLPLVLCLYQEHWHPGVVGLVASRIKDRFHRPVVAFASDAEGRLKGSARSVRGLHVRDVLTDVDARHPGMIERFGGHAMAAGLTLSGPALEPFRRALERAVADRAEGADLSGVLTTDGELPPDRLDLATAELLRTAGPWGQGFPEPLFDGEFRVRDARIVGGRHLRCRLEPEGGRPVQAIFFGFGTHAAPAPGARVRAVYRLDVNDYRGVRSAQLVVEHMAPV
jgi:single-stranded-DNA-specific exonuclease